MAFLELMRFDGSSNRLQRAVAHSMSERAFIHMVAFAKLQMIKLVELRRSAQEPYVSGGVER